MRIGIGIGIGIGRLRPAALAVALATVLAAPPLTAQQTPPPAQPPAGGSTTVEGVTVRAQPDKADTDTRVRGYVRSVLGKPSRTDSLARWRDPVCPFITGMDREQAIFLIQRLRTIATEAGARIGQRHCAPNLFVIATDDPQGLLRAWSAKDHFLFGEESKPAGERFIRKARPVRAWYNFVPRKGGSRSKLVFERIRVLDSVIVVIDAKQMAGIKTRQLSDYVIMLALAQVDLDAEQGDVPTILALFDPNRSPPDGLSSWDRALLRALYRTSQGFVGQRSEIARSIERQLKPPPGAPSSLPDDE